MTTTVHVRDVKTGRVHKRFREDGQRGLFAFESEAKDTSGAFTILTDAEFEQVDAHALCPRCYGEATE